MIQFVLETHGLTIGYSQPIAEPISVILRPGEMVCLIGPNGAGKSTLLRTLAGMQRPLGGSIWLEGEDIARLKAAEIARRLSIVLTERIHVGMLPAYELVALGRYPYTDWTGKLTDHDRSVIEWAVGAVGAKALAQRQFNELSDGERQKMMIARALAQETHLIILDEPTAFLDLPRRVDLMQMLKTLARDTGRAVLLSTHDLDLALRTADRIWLLSARGFSAGAPEDLVLNGQFEAAFRAEGVHFDREDGAFRLEKRSGKRAAVSGDGLALIWTRRALEREGFLIDEDAPLCIEALPRNKGFVWKVSGILEGECGSIDDLLIFLRRAG